MGTLAIPNRYVPWLRVSVASIVFVATVMLFSPFYLPGVLAPLYGKVDIDPMSPAMLQLMRGMFFHNLFFSQPGHYLLASLLVMVLLLTVLLLARPGRPTSVLLGLTLISVLAVPWIYGYQPAVSAAPGYRMLTVTQPGLLDGVTKRAQQFAEVRLCDYFLLGWSADETLYYREQCRGAAPLLSAFSPSREGSRVTVESVPPDISAESKRSVAEWVRSPSWTRGPDGRLVESAEAEGSGIRIKLRESGVASPSGRRVAVVARHIYGPEDVLILSMDTGSP